MEINEIKEGSTTPNFDSDLGDGDSDGDGDGDGDEKGGNVAPNLGDIDGKQGSMTSPCK